MEGSIIVNNQQYSFTEFSELGFEKLPVSALKAQLFVHKWLSNSKVFTIKTSGSSGKPKEIEITRKQMIVSANNTIKALDLKPKTHALMAMSVERIGGLMMLVRSLVGGWHLHLHAPTNNLALILEERSFDFSALVPLQVETLISEDKGYLLESIECLLLGGAGLSTSLQEILNKFQNRIFHSYGMTETVSHIALRKISQQQNTPWFTLIGDNQIGTDENDCLKVKGAVTDYKWVHTHDLIEQNANMFRWLSRVDLVINSGGVKLQIEELELRLNKLIPNHLSGNLCIWKRLDDKLGEKVVCICDSVELIQYFHTNEKKLKPQFVRYGWPKKWHHIASLILTASGKIDRVNSLTHSVPISI